MLFFEPAPAETSRQDRNRNLGPLPVITLGQKSQFQRRFKRRLRVLQGDNEDTRSHHDRVSSQVEIATRGEVGVSSIIWGRGIMARPGLIFAKKGTNRYFRVISAKSLRQDDRHGLFRQR